jgi:hypothetical protein
MADLHRAGYGPSAALFDVNTRIALASSLMFTALKFDHVPPASRRSFSSMAEHYSKNVHGQATKRLIKEKQELAA